MAALSTFRASVLPVTVKNTFIDDLADRVSPKPTARSFSLPPSLDRSPGESTAAKGPAGLGNDGWDSETEDETSSRGAKESGGNSTDTDTAILRRQGSGGTDTDTDAFPDTDDEWEAGSRRLPNAGAGLAVVPAPPRRASCPAAVPIPAAPVVALIPFPADVPSPPEPDEAEPDAREGRRRRRCRACRGRMGDRCPCTARADAVAAPATTTTSPRTPPAAAAARSHAHAIAVRSVLADGKDAPRALAETTLKVSCTEEGGGIVVERVVKRARLSSQAQEWPALGAAAPAAGRTKLSSKAAAWQPAAGGAAAPPAEASAGAESPREAPAPAPARGAPRFGLALLQYVRDAMRKNAFVAGVTISASATAGWCMRLGVRGQHLYLKDHVLACAQEALFDALDELEALRARAPGGGRGVPETAFDLKVERSGSS